MSKTKCYLGVGGNISNELGTPIQHILKAVATLQQTPNIENVKMSSLYRSKAFGVTDQPDFYNAVVSFDTTLAPLELLDICQDIEQSAGRVRLRHWGERSLDVDILLYGDEIIQNERLTVPHAGLLERNFVVIPLLELDKNLTVNGKKLMDFDIAYNWRGLEKNDEADFNSYLDFYDARFLKTSNKNSIDEINGYENRAYQYGLMAFRDFNAEIDFAVKQQLKSELGLKPEHYESDWFQQILSAQQLSRRFKIARRMLIDKRPMMEIMLHTALNREQIEAIDITV